MAHLRLQPPCSRAAHGAELQPRAPEPRPVFELHTGSANPHDPNATRRGRLERAMSRRTRRTRAPAWVPPCCARSLLQWPPGAGADGDPHGVTHRTGRLPGRTGGKTSQSGAAAVSLVHGPPAVGFRFKRATTAAVGFPQAVRAPTDHEFNSNLEAAAPAKSSCELADVLFMDYRAGFQTEHRHLRPELPEQPGSCPGSRTTGR